ncbi:MAG: ribulose-phosphate 3-epimerase [Proteobacteria bacterium]|nr:ribulose-phosphate 3-epimerase [Pseudomonadota bacterium]NQW46035.1 ribulose-phosphate 3-epimerase [Deltaproteobacteria bacterium]
MALKSKTFKLAPSLLASDLSCLGTEVQKLEKAGIEVLHFDIMDGNFVPNITFGFPVLQALRKKTKLIFDAHLMINDADRYLEDFKKAGCDWLSVHVEACSHLHGTVQKIQKLGMTAGVAINPGTSLDELNGILDFADFILLMSVNPGFAGQSFIENSFERVRELKKRIGKRKIKIQIDGGIKKENIREAVLAGCDILVMGTGFFSFKDYKIALTELSKEATRGD